ncbi:hypothetical protein [Streptacidiphilus carbonis]|uniref:hypothetical protein n=1 Tax=Streptacidiphilus carbonis TaxID=105422 RepID=UPI0005A74CF7|nr:hypothetical protein [Streptacidiphilus carbonis]
MASLALPRPRTTKPRPHQLPDAQRHRAAAAMRAVGRRIGHHPAYACDICHVGWAGPEQDCWGCGRPASDYSRRASTLQLLLRQVAPAAKADR